MSYQVPMIVNGHQLPDDLYHERMKVTIEKINREYLALGRINCEPCYQRDKVWSIKQNRAFIQSCFSKKMAIPPIYLCKKKDRRKTQFFDALDGRQRLTALRSFLNNEFYIPVYKYDENGEFEKRMKLYWTDIESNEEFFEMKEDFLNREIEVVKFDPMSYEEQRKVFVALNAGTPLNADEENYCPNFLARSILGDMFDRVFRSDSVVSYDFDPNGDADSPGSGLASQVQTSVRCGRRFAHLRVMHEVLILTKGMSGSNGDFELDDPKPRGCKRIDRRRSAEAIHEVLGEHGFDFDDDVTDDIYEVLGLSDCIKPLTQTADFLAGLFDNEKGLGRASGKGKSRDSVDRFILPRNAIDPLCFLYTISHDRYTTVAKLKKDRKKVVRWLEEYYRLKLELDYNAATSDVLTMTGKYLIMRELFNRMFKTKIPAWPSEAQIDNSKVTAVRAKIAEIMVA